MGPKVHVVGAGLAGSEAVWQLVRRGIAVILHEMRPNKLTPAHQTGSMAELVCSNSLKSMSEDSAPGQLKREMTALDSLVIKSAYAAKVPAGQALAVNREEFSTAIEQALLNSGLVTRQFEEVTTLPSIEEMIARDEYWLLATGPLTTEPLAAEILNLSGGQKRLHFYDAIAPVIDAESIDMSKGAFIADRWQDEGATGGDYLNIPLNKDQYLQFIDAVLAAEKMPLHDFEETKYFESCLPIEVMAERGKDTLRFGPMKPAGLTNPQTGRWPYAAVQLRLENKEATMYSIVGFQTKMKWPEQRRVFAMLPGLENAEYHRFGSVHRNTYIKSPEALSADLSFKSNDRVFLAGQVTGVEGYTESAAIGLLAGRALGAKVLGEAFKTPPKETMLGALHRYVTEGTLGDYQPMNANLGLLPPIPKQKGLGKSERKALQTLTAWKTFEAWQIN
ncbi:MAG: methylenetetrahydrofolate--tRNA-(uracil(54)-C(5))-methyltransferase (FADH(2)-oxidizing) TrmFO [Proteobacteria bacterium]|nr:methylenetetrahydrofolate--tRNA-(uracil(54)-C(5))-methyltransferase (FADH(2)-oxidizing) TrmFO [Pseudomonadota bacterium]